MAVEFSCREAGHLGCGWKAKADTEEALLERISQHAKKDHGIEQPTETIVEYLKSTVRKA